MFSTVLNGPLDARDDAKVSQAQHERIVLRSRTSMVVRCVTQSRQEDDKIVIQKNFNVFCTINTKGT